MEDCINREDVTEKATQDESIVDVRLTQPRVQGVTRHKPALNKKIILLQTVSMSEDN